MKQPLRIVALEIENVKTIRVVEIRPKHAVTPITGRNGAGKSTVLDAVFMAFGGKDAVPAQPVRRGEQKARIRLDLGEIVVTRKFDASGTTSVRVESADGASYSSPQKILDGLYSRLSFDPLSFMRLAPKEQAETLRQLVPLDVDVDALDRANARDFELRTSWNHRIKSFEERVQTVRAGIDETMDVTLEDVSALVDQMANASAHNAAIDQAERDRLRWSLERETRLSDAEIARQEAARLIAKAERLEQDAKELAARIDAQPEPPAPIDVTALKQQIDQAQKMNAIREHQAHQRRALATAQDELTQARRESDALTHRMDKRKADKAAAIARAKMPVPGLSFDAGEVFYNGLPLAQASTAEQLRVSFALAVAANPTLRVVLIRDGSLLDEESLCLIAEMAEQSGVQVLMERVGTNGQVGIVLENGEVVSVDGRPVEQEAQPAGV